MFHGGSSAAAHTPLESLLAGENNTPWMRNTPLIHHVLPAAAWLESAVWVVSNWHGEVTWHPNEDSRENTMNVNIMIQTEKKVKHGSL